MRCPVDNSDLEQDSMRDLSVERCGACSGVWLDHGELASLEDQELPEGVPKGTIYYGDHPSDRNCPHCGKHMVRFRYRAWPLELERCPDESGFWLDRDEEEKILDYMKQRRDRLARSASAQRSWRRFITGGRPGLLERIKDLFR